MSKLIIALWFALSATVVYAGCATQTISQGGRFVVCTTCCDNYGNCNTFCN